ncbi:MAG: conserved rane protein of unknown function [Sphingomonas bacterium]|uniref:MFS transporter n=1 Tax=Sphingomonas bacterium TaxID=1895847 RepID=UPI0026328774|nr:MFS transporter [Sphingomonas bacterium]MDB5694605.1 conserved rane protein of unknown function [Sphingomonas bacterium]
MSATSGPAPAAQALQGASSTASLGPLRVREKLFYGLGEIGEAVKTAALETFLLFYYVQVVGLSGSLSGLALLVALLFDAVSDPMIGSWSDRLRSRLGRRHPFLYAAPIPLLIALVLLFSPPDGLSQIALFAWLTVFAIISRVAMAAYFVPHMALGADLSDRFEERIEIGGYRTGFSYFGRLVALGAAFSIFFAATADYPRGQLNPAAYTPFAIFCGVTVAVAVFVSALGTQKRAMRLPPAPVPPHGSGVLRTVGRAMKLTSFRAMFLSLLLFYIFNGTQATLALHMTTFYWELSPTQTRNVLFATVIGFIVGVFFVGPIARRWDKKPAYIAGVIASCTCVSAPVLLRLLGWFPANGDPMLVPAMIFFFILYGICGSVPVTLSSAMLADVADDYDLRHGMRSEGMFFGAIAFSRKASTGAGTALAGVLLDVIAFPQNAVVGQVPEATLYHLALLYGPMLLAILCSGCLVLAPYDLSRTRHEEIIRVLAGRNAKGLD